MSTTQETTNKATFRHLTEAMNTGDRDLMSKAIDEAYAPDALIHTPMPVQATGSQAIKEVFGGLYQAFPDLHIAVDDLIEEDDKMVARNTVTFIGPSCLSTVRSLDRRQPEPRSLCRFA